MDVVNISEVKTPLTRIVKGVWASEEVVITRAGEPLIRLTAYQADLAPRLSGQLPGTLWMAEDFDAPGTELEYRFYEGGL